MRHRSKKTILGRGYSSRKALFKSLLKSFFEHEQIRTTQAKAKAIKPLVERLITTGRNGTLSNRRKILASIGSPKLAQKIISEISPRYKDIKGGYTRIIKIGNRKGDNAPEVFLSLIKKKSDEKQTAKKTK